MENWIRKKRCFPYNAGAGGGKNYKWKERKKGCRGDCLTEWQTDLGAEWQDFPVPLRCQYSAIFECFYPKMRYTVLGITATAGCLSGVKHQFIMKVHY